MTKAALLILCLFLVVTSTLASEDLLYREDPQQRLQECKHKCRQQRQGQSQRQKCFRKCQLKYQQGSNIEEDSYSSSSPEEEVAVRSQRNPYVFDQESFVHAVRSEHGSIRVLPNFIKRSKLLLGLVNHRLAVLEASPNTFVVPNHLDADAVFYVMKGEGTVALIRGQNRESWNVKQGEVIKVSAGTVVYLINRSSSRRLQIVKLLRPVSTPGQFEMFPTASYYRVFSTEILEAALNTREERLERLFGQQRREAIVKATEEQIRALSRHASSSSSHGSVWPFGTDSSSTYNVFNKRATYSNRHGRLHEVDVQDYRALKDVDVQVTYVNITRGSMMAPFFNTRAAKVAYVTRGRGYFEMVCPHLSQQQQEQGEDEEEDGRRGGKFRRVEARLRKGTVFVVPAGHPVALVAGEGENLEVVCFEVNAKGNRRTFVAGKRNVVSLMEEEAKELAFGVPSKLVDEVFEKGQEEVFVRGPEGREEEKSEGGERASNFETFLEFAGF